MNWETLEDYRALSRRAASILLDCIRSNPRAVLGLPTGSTPLATYEEIVRECEREYRCFTSVTTFNLDEYVGIPPTHPGSYRQYMQKRLFDHVDVDPANIHIPHGLGGLDSARAGDLEAALERECMRYEERIVSTGGIDLLFLGLGRNGHIAFNEPGTKFSSRTHVVDLAPSTRDANAKYFPDGEVPHRAITMGIGTILDAEQIVLLASGSAKHDAVARLRSGEQTEEFPASALHAHPRVLVLVDEEAAAE